MKNQIYLHMVARYTQHERWKTREIADEFNLDIYQARYYLMHLCQDGKVVKAGIGRGTPVYWSLSPG